MMHELMKTPGGGYEVYVLIIGWLYNEELHDLFTLPDVLGDDDGEGRVGKCTQDFSWKTCIDPAWKAR